jgi:PAS domain S-box-containing protein
MFVLALLALVAGGTLFYRSEERHLRVKAEEDLTVIARLKVEQIVKWRTEHLTDAAVLIDSPYAAQAFTDWLAEPRPELAEPVLSRFRSRQQFSHYYDVLLVDAAGEVSLSLSGRTGSLHEDAARYLADAFRDRRPVLSDLHIGPGDLPPHMDVIAPIFTQGPGGSPLGAVILQSDTRQFLYPMIETWPGESPSAETLLVRRDGDAVLFLSELRHRKNAPLTLRIPLSRTDMPEVMAGLGQEGVFRGSDYRGVEVLSSLRAVPGSSWLVVAKIDAAEIFEAWRSISVLIMMLMLSGVAALVAVVAIVWQRRAKLHYQEMFREKAARLESEASYRTLVETLPQFVWTCRPDGACDYLSPQWVHYTGVAEQEQLGYGWTRQVHPADWPRLQERWEESVRTGNNFDIEFRIRRADGVYRWFHTRALPLRGADGEIIKWFGTNTDIEEQKQTESTLKSHSSRLETDVEERTRELREAQAQLLRQERLAAVGQLAGSIGHELRNPLAVMANAVYYLRLVQPDAGDKVKEYLGILENEIRTAEKIISDLLDFSRIKSLDRTAVTPAELIAQSLERFPVPADITVVPEVAADLPAVFIDQRQMIQVLGNLVVNACQAMPQGGTLTLAARRDGEMVALAVTDTGTGITAENMARLFEPLFTTKARGIGLGLAVSRKLVEANGGRIEACSDMGRGATFTVFLPVRQEGT